MRQIILLATLTLELLTSDIKAEKQQENQFKATWQIPFEKAKEKERQNIYIKDYTKYSIYFLDELLDMNFNKTVKLIDNYIIIGKDTTNFPSVLKINQETVFKATKDKIYYDLRVKRVNETTLEFKLNIIDTEKKIGYAETGKATLKSTFFLAPEVDLDEQTGEKYGSYEYLKKNNDNWLSIRIGIEKDSNGRLRAIVTSGFNDMKSDKNSTGKWPILRTE